MKHIAILLASTLLTGCASIVSKSSYPVVINSTPQQATFEIIDSKGQPVESGTTPDTVTLKSGAGFFKTGSYTVRLTRAGYESTSYALNASMDGWYFGNILLGGLIGMLIVDPATGAMYRLPPRVDVPLNQSAAKQAPMADSFEIAMIGDLMPEDVMRLQKIDD